VFVLTGQQMGYLQPCGCSEPQIGGLERRYNLVQQMKEAGWRVVPLDTGDVPQAKGPAGLRNLQALIKYRYAMRAMNEIGYKGVAYGELEAGLGMFDIHGEYWLNDAEPRGVMSNHIDGHKNFPDMAKPWWYVDVKEAEMRVGIAAIVGPTVAARIKEVTGNNPKMRFSETKATLKDIAAQMGKGGVAFPVLLWQGPVSRDALVKEKTEAMRAAEEFPQFPLVVALADEDEPAFRPTMVGRTMVVAPGRKGKYVAAVGVWKTGDAKKPFELKYERVEITPDFVTPAEKVKGHPIAKLMEDYTAELKSADYLGKYGQDKHALQAMAPVKGLRNPGNAEYAGSEACMKCHEHAWDVWKKVDDKGRGHSVAYQTLVDARKPGNRHHDPECIVCHTVGFGYQTGYRSEPGYPAWVERQVKAGEKIDPKKHQHGLKDVGCESCHGPSSLHVRNPDDKEWQKRINPWRHQFPGKANEAKKNHAIDQMCQKCHDIDNDVHWIGGGFAKKWPKVEHYTPAAKDE
ncbi:MAG: hypothetical protein K2W96_22140, partial [Gemmataceae bacterium]|nr:hypothetical protein [Gemmataceae bacterium]